MSWRLIYKVILVLTLVASFYIVNFYKDNQSLYVLIACTLFIGYFFGSFTGGPIFAKLFNLGDLQKIGSGNIGTTNVLRTGNKLAAFLTLIFDALKGVVAIKVINFLFIHDLPLEFEYISAFGCLIGHFAPLFNDFKGGKGIATLAGISLTFSWPIALSLFVLWLAVVVLTRYSSVGGISSVIFAIPICYGLNDINLMYFFIVTAPLVLWKHRDNIERLVEGRETKIGSSSNC